MLFKAVVLESQGGEITIARTPGGAHAIANHEVIAEFTENVDRDARYAKAAEIARLLYGDDRRGRPAATNSMIGSVLEVIDRVAER